MARRRQPTPPAKAKGSDKTKDESLDKTAGKAMQKGGTPQAALKAPPETAKPAGRSVFAAPKPSPDTSLGKAAPDRTAKPGPARRAPVSPRAASQSDEAASADRAVADAVRTARAAARPAVATSTLLGGASAGAVGAAVSLPAGTPKLGEPRIAPRVIEAEQPEPAEPSETTARPETISSHPTADAPPPASEPPTRKAAAAARSARGSHERGPTEPAPPPEVSAPVATDRADPIVSSAPLEPQAAVPPSPIPTAAPNWPTGGYPAFGPTSASINEINETVAAYLRAEGEATLAHMRALAQVRSTGEFFRLQVGEFQRAADASMTCVGTILRSASRLGGLRRP